MTRKLNSTAFGLSAALISALVMAFLGIAARFGIYTEAAEMMGRWHLFFDTSTKGIAAGMAEAAVVSFVTAFLFAALYNTIDMITKG